MDTMMLGISSKSQALFGGLNIFSTFSKKSGATSRAMVSLLGRFLRQACIASMRIRGVFERHSSIDTPCGLCRGANAEKARRRYRIIG